MTGRTAISSRAATVAARVGMLVVSAAGNEGKHPWHYISAPPMPIPSFRWRRSTRLGNRASFQLLRPVTADGRIKPTLAAMGLWPRRCWLAQRRGFSGQRHLLCLPGAGGHGGRLLAGQPHAHGPAGDCWPCAAPLRRLTSPTTRWATAFPASCGLQCLHPGAPLATAAGGRRGRETLADCTPTLAANGPLTLVLPAELRASRCACGCSMPRERWWHAAAVAGRCFGRGAASAGISGQGNLYVRSERGQHPPNGEICAAISPDNQS